MNPSINTFVKVLNYSSMLLLGLLFKSRAFGYIAKNNNKYRPIMQECAHKPETALINFRTPDNSNFRSGAQRFV